MLVCAHMDTVPLTAPVEVDSSEGLFRNRNDAILGADNKAAVAVFLQAARRWTARRPPVGVELLFTTSEETGLRGAKAFDRDRLSADFGYVYDHASADRRAGRRRADPLRDHGGLPRARRARGHPAGGGAQRDRRRGAGDRPGSLGPDRRGDDAERRRHRGRHRGQRRRRALPGRVRGPQPRQREGERPGEPGGRRAARGRPAQPRPTSMRTWRSTSARTGSPTSDPCVEVASGALRDCGIEPVLHAIRRRQRRQRVRGARPALPQRRERDGGKPHLGRARHARRRSRRCST